MKPSVFAMGDQGVVAPPCLRLLWRHFSHLVRATLHAG